MSREPVRSPPAMDVFLFPEYILPAFENFYSDEDVGVRIAHASCIGPSTRKPPLLVIPWPTKLQHVPHLNRF